MLAYHLPPVNYWLVNSATRDFLSGIAPGKTKALRRKQAIVAFASMVGGMTLARTTARGELRLEILKDVVHAASNGVVCATV